MKISPNYTLSVFREEELSEKMSAVTQKLGECRQEGTFAGVDGKDLYYEYFQCENSRGAVVIVHGLSEFTAKYHEFAWYLLNQGYDVFLYDQRSHGRSCRLTPRQDLIHVDSFSDYRKDLHLFITNVVRKVSDLPLYLYSHSMGGAVALDYLAHHPDTFQKAVLSAPMILPLTGGVPPLVARLGLGLFWLLGSGKKKFWLADEFDPDYPFERSTDKSRARFLRNMEIRLANPCYCTTPLSIRWVQQSVSLRRRLTSRRFLKKISTPILMIRAEKDQVVCMAAQEAFAKNCPTCKKVIIPDSSHGMLCGLADTITAHIQEVLDHFH